MTKAQKKNLGKYKGNNPRKAKKERHSAICPVCGRGVKMLKVSEMGFDKPLFPGTEDTLYWVCHNYPACNTYIKADPKTKKMNGTMAGPSLRFKRSLIHYWEALMESNHIMTKQGFRSMCGAQIGFHNQGVVHTREMSEYECDTIINYLHTLYQNRAQIRDAVDRIPNSAIYKYIHGLNVDPHADKTPNSTLQKSAEQNGTK